MQAFFLKKHGLAHLDANKLSVSETLWNEPIKYMCARWI